MGKMDDGHSLWQQRHMQDEITSLNNHGDLELEDPQQQWDEVPNALECEVADGLIAASGTIGAQNPSIPTTLGSFRPAVEDNQFFPLFPTLTNLEPDLSGSVFPSAGRHLSSVPETFGLSPSFAPESRNATTNQSTLVPPRRALRSTPLSQWTLPVPTLNSATETATANEPIAYEIFRATDVSDNSGQGRSQMPVEPGNSISLGDAYDDFDFDFSGGPTSAAAAAAGSYQFAPPNTWINPLLNLDNYNLGNYINQQLPTSPAQQGQPSDTLNNGASFPYSWPSQPQQSFDISAGSGGSRQPNSDDQFLGLLGGDFSSPSLPPLSSPPPRPNNAFACLHPAVPAPSFQSQLQNAADNMPIQATSHTAASERGRRPRAPSLVDLTSPKLEREGDVPRALDRATPMRAPNSRKRTRDSTTGSRAGTTERRTPTSTKSRPIKSLKRQASTHEDDPFAESSPAPQGDDDDVLDLTGTDELPAEPQLPPVDNRVKLSKFQCSICMDDATGLTVTHCGHLFCSECLHSALHIDHLKRTCPICRQKVELKNKTGSKQPKNSFYHLELKLMTANRKGKRPVGQ